MGAAAAEIASQLLSDLRFGGRFVVARSALACMIMPLMQ